MKSLWTSSLIAFGSIYLSCPVFALERKPIEDINMDDLTAETQQMPSSGDEHLTLAWWIPIEFWKTSFSSDPSIPPEEAAQMLSNLRKFSILGVVQADISEQGAFQFYSEEKVKEGLKVFVIDSNGLKSPLLPSTREDPSLTELLNVMKPILSGAMGNLGQNLHFFVFDDLDPDDKRIIDPYQSGSLQIATTTSDGKAMWSEIQFPLNALYIPRKCPNGRDAHVSWVFCPWTGKKLPE